MENISFLIKTGDPNKMNAGFLVLGGICEGCMD
jgi:hypothetical protein